MLGCGRGKEKPVFVSESKASPIGVSPSLAAHFRRAAGPQRRKDSLAKSKQSKMYLRSSGGVSTQPSLHCYSLCVKSAELQTVDFLDGKELCRAELLSICWGRKSPPCGTHSLGCDPNTTPQRPYLRGPRAWHRANTERWRQWMFSEGMNECTSRQVSAMRDHDQMTILRSRPGSF